MTAFDAVVFAARIQLATCLPTLMPSLLFSVLAANYLAFVLLAGHVPETPRLASYRLPQVTALDFELLFATLALSGHLHSAAVLARTALIRVYVYLLTNFGAFMPTVEYLSANLSTAWFGLSAICPRASEQPFDRHLSALAFFIFLDQERAFHTLSFVAFQSARVVRACQLFIANCFA